MAEKPVQVKSKSTVTQSSSEDHQQLQPAADQNDTDNIDILLTAAQVLERDDEKRGDCKEKKTVTGTENHNVKDPESGTVSKDPESGTVRKDPESGKVSNRGQKLGKTGKKHPVTGKRGQEKEEMSQNRQETGQPVEDNGKCRDQGKNKNRKLTLKALLGMPSISSEMLKKLPTQMLRSLFLEQIDNECGYSKKSTYQCRFFNESHEKKCTQQFLGFGGFHNINPSIDKHLAGHLNDVLKDDVPFETTSVIFLKKQGKANKKTQVSSPPASKKAKTFTSLKSGSSETENQSDQKSPKSSEKKTSNRKRKIPVDENENNPTASTSTPDPDEEAPTTKKRKSSVSENSNGPLDDSVSEEETKDESAWHFDHSYCAAPGRKPKQMRPQSPQSDSDDSSVHSKVSVSSPDAHAPEAESCEIIYDGIGVAHHETIIEQEESEEKGQVKESSKKARLGARRKIAPIPDDEKRKAVHYIEELKNKKKEIKIPWVCKICPGRKAFTAGASLLNHYKSHAGLKPFRCADCGNTFTRQHSLLYHKRIHTGEVKHTCTTCGRKFRHSAHFKEHLRKHTGETPYSCGDCSQQFKTRNTYKRHLKTHHGKLLTKDGIRPLSDDERALVKTKKYKKSSGSSPNSSPEQKFADQKRSKKVKVEKPTPSVAPVDSTSTSTPSRVPLPPVSTILPILQPAAPTQAVHVNPTQFVTSVSQPSVGVMPSIGVVGQSPGTAMVGMAVQSQGVVVCGPITNSTQVIQLPYNNGQPTTLSCQQAVPLYGSVQGQAVYALNAVVKMEKPSAVYPAHQQVTQGATLRSDIDISEYKPVGYVSHS